MATTASLDALDDTETPTARVYLQKAAQAADGSWQQTIQGHSGPTITNPTAADIEQSGPSSQQDDEDIEPTFASPAKIGSAHHSSKHNIPHCLTEPDCDV